MFFWVWVEFGRLVGGIDDVSLVCWEIVQPAIELHGTFDIERYPRREVSLDVSMATLVFCKIYCAFLMIHKLTTRFQKRVDHYHYGRSIRTYPSLYHQIKPSTATATATATATSSPSPKSSPE